jgi:hypothetical protein
VSGVRVNFDRPYAKYPQVTDSLETLTRCKAFLSVGHDEYWSRSSLVTYLPVF